MSELADYLWILGVAIVGVVLLQSLVALYGALQGLVHSGAQRRLSLELMQQRVAAARRRQLQQEQVALLWDGYRKFEVDRKVDEGGDICSFYFVPHDRKPLPPFKPGQYLTFDLSIADQRTPTVRCYSLSDAPGREYYRVTVKRIPPPPDNPDAPPGLASNFLHDRVNPGDILDVKAPGGHFWLDMSRATPVVLIAGGVGVTPLLSMLNAIAESGSVRETWFFYGVCHRDEHIMYDHFDRLAAEHENIHLHVCYSEPRTGVDLPGRDFHHAEWVSVELLRRLLPSSNYDYYICGPPPMMGAITQGLEQWGVPSNRVHYETFGPATVKKLQTPIGDGATVDVTFSRSGKTCQWGPEEGSLLELAEHNEIVIDCGCRAGNCGTCLTAIKSGEVEYTTEPGAVVEDGSCLTCICVPKGPLVLDA